MKKVLIALFLCFCSTAHAGVKETLEKVPAIKQGFAYSMADKKMNYLATFEVAKWKGLTFEAGYAGYAEETGAKLVGVMSYELVKLKNYVQLPILDLVEFNPGIYFGAGRLGGSNETDWGISASLIKMKF